MSARNDHRRPAVLITGATGALGEAVIRCFEEGWAVRILSRRPPGSGRLAAAHQHFAAEIDDRDALRRAMYGVDVVVHMAALLHVSEPDESVQAEYDRVNVLGTATVMEAALDASVKRVVGLSSIAVYGPSTELLTEESSPAPDTPYARTKLEAEGVLLRAMNNEGRPIASVLRLAAVYGPSVKGNYERLVRALARRRFLPIGSGTNTRTLIFEDDAAEAIRLAATHSAAPGEVFNVTDGSLHTVADILDAICAALGRRRPLLSLPVPLVQFAASTSDALFRAVGKRSPVTPGAIAKYRESNAVSGDRIQRVLGFKARWTLEAGWIRTVEAMRSEGRI